jgi:para-aminobenzoate synthetase / 4-amino-4-deoxychorismate lyase
VDGRLLPGVTRARLLRLAGSLGLTAAEEEITLERLRQADGAFLTSALRGAVAARLAGGPGPHPLVPALADALGSVHALGLTHVMHGLGPACD